MIFVQEATQGDHIRVHILLVVTVYKNFVSGVVDMCYLLMKVSSVNAKISPCGILRTACEILTLHPEPSTRISRDPKTSQLSIGNEPTTPISRNPKTSQSKIESVQKCTDAKKIISVDPKILPVSAYHVDIKNHVKIENLLLQEVKYEKSGRKFKAFRVMNSFNTSTSRSIRCFHHFKVRNIWIFSPLVSSKREKNILVLLILYIF